MPKKIIAFAVILLTICWVGNSSASMVSFLGNNGAENLGSFSGYISYTANDSQTATLTIELTNTSPAATGGYLTAFAFNNPNNDITGVSLATTPGNAFQLVGAPGFRNGISASPYGNFDIGASISRDFLGGGNPKAGIAPGQSVSFTFALSGAHLDDLTWLSFVNELSDRSKESQFFAARFRGFNNGGSDKVPGFIHDPVNATPTPLPSTLALMGPALVGLAAFRRLRRP